MRLPFSLIFVVHAFRLTNEDDEGPFKYAEISVNIGIEFQRLSATDLSKEGSYIIHFGNRGAALISQCEISTVYNIGFIAPVAAFTNDVMRLMMSTGGTLIYSQLPIKTSVALTGILADTICP